MMISTSYSSTRERRQTHKSMNVAMFLLLALGACAQSYRWYVSPDAVEDPGAYAPSEHMPVGRGFQRRLLEQQIMDKDNEIAYLRRQIEKVELTTRVENTKVEAMETLALELSGKVQKERQARNKAQLALSEKASMLQVCQVQRSSVEAEVEECGTHIIAIRQSRKRKL